MKEAIRTKMREVKDVDDVRDENDRKDQPVTKATTSIVAKRHNCV